jgi:transcriptional regulator with XRE-family HTH domain
MDRNPVDALIGRRIRALRLAHGLSLSQLGVLIGVSAMDMEMFEIGTRRVGARRIVRIAKALNIDVGALFGNWGACEPTEMHDVLRPLPEGAWHSPSRSVH